MSCETDPESVVKDDSLHPLLFCVLFFLSPVQRLHRFLAPFKTKANIFVAV